MFIQRSDIQFFLLGATACLTIPVETLYTCITWNFPDSLGHIIRMSNFPFNVQLPLLAAVPHPPKVDKGLNARDKSTATACRPPAIAAAFHVFITSRDTITRATTNDVALCAVKAL